VSRQVLRGGGAFACAANPPPGALPDVFGHLSSKLLAGDILAAFLAAAARLGSEESNILANYSSAKPRFEVLAHLAQGIERCLDCFYILRANQISRRRAI
jgi:hypothetical protein